MLGKRIKEIIHQRDLKQKAVARAADIPEKQFSNMVNGRKKIDDRHILPICRALDITPNELFGYNKSA